MNDRSEHARINPVGLLFGLVAAMVLAYAASYLPISSGFRWVVQIVIVAVCLTVFPAVAWFMTTAESPPADHRDDTPSR